MICLKNLHILNFIVPPKHNITKVLDQSSGFASFFN